MIDRRITASRARRHGDRLFDAASFAGDRIITADHARRQLADRKAMDDAIAEIANTSGALAGHLAAVSRWGNQLRELGVPRTSAERRMFLAYFAAGEAIKRFTIEARAARRSEAGARKGAERSGPRQTKAAEPLWRQAAAMFDAERARHDGRSDTAIRREIGDRHERSEAWVRKAIKKVRTRGAGVRA